VTTSETRHDLEVERVSAELADDFQQLEPDAIEQDVRAKFGRWSQSPVQDFVPIFVTLAVREKLRRPGRQDTGDARYET
jgi:hypothetical protein